MEQYTVYYKNPYGQWQKDMTTNNIDRAREREKQIARRGFYTKVVEH